MRVPPLEVLSSWPSPNYKDPTTRGNELLIMTCVLFPIAMIMIGLRTFTRISITHAWGMDDILLLCSIPPTCTIAVSSIYAVEVWGWDRHIWDVEHSDVSKGLRLLLALLCLFAVAVSFYKMSILILTKRIMTSTTGMLPFVANATLLAVIAEAVVFCIVVINTCSPVSAYWTLSFKPQHCMNERIHLLIAGIINTCTDFLVFALPLPTVLQLKIPLRQQVILGLLFGAGFAVCIAGISRIIYTWKATSSYDRTWEAYGLWMSCLIELYVGIICASIPGCKPFFTRYLPALLGSTLNQSESTNMDCTRMDMNTQSSGTLSTRYEARGSSASAIKEDGTHLNVLGKKTAATYTMSDSALQAGGVSALVLNSRPEFHQNLHELGALKQVSTSTWLKTPSESGEDNSFEERSDRSSKELRVEMPASTVHVEHRTGRRRSRTPRSKFSTTVGQDEGENKGRIEVRDDPAV